MKKFLKDLENELKKLKISKKDIDEILADHQEMIEAAKTDGIDDKDLENKFGNPKKLAEEIKKDIKITSIQEPVLLKDADSCVKTNVKDYNLVKTFPVTEDKLSVNIRLVSNHVSFTTYEGDSIQVYETNIKEIKQYTITYENNVFTLKKEKSVVVMFNFTKKRGRFIVLVPQNIDIDLFEYKTVSGDGKINGIKVNKFNIKSTSGDIDITNLLANMVKVTSVNGDFDINKLNAKSFDISLVSGDLKMYNALIRSIVSLLESIISSNIHNM